MRAVADIIWSICAIGLVTAAGRGARRASAVGDGGVESITGLVYWIASPAMLFHAIATTGIRSIPGSPLAAAAGCDAGAALVFRGAFGPGPSPASRDPVFGSVSASLSNGACIGIPNAVYVRGTRRECSPSPFSSLGSSR